MRSPASSLRPSRERWCAPSRSNGRGATEAKTYQCDGFLFFVLKDGMTTAERNLLEHGEERLVREVKLRLQELNAPTFQEAVEQVTGRRALTYPSQVLFSPGYTASSSAGGWASG